MSFYLSYILVVVISRPLWFIKVSHSLTHGLGALVQHCEGGEGGEGLKWFDMHVIVYVTSRAFK